MATRLYEGNRTQADIDAYNRGWARYLVDILQEQIDKLSVSDTGSLKQSVEYAIDGTDTIKHKLLKYGLYVSAGVGKGFKHGNGGDLLFMNDTYREVNGYGYKQVGASLSEDAMLAPKMYGEAYQGLVSSFLQGLFGKLDSTNRIRSNRF